MGKTLYEIIDVHKQATQAEIEEACKQLGEAFRPDKNTGNIIAYERFSEIERAYETLIDPDKRAKYDRELNTASDESKRSHIGWSMLGGTHWKKSRIAIIAVCCALAAWFLVKNSSNNSEGLPSVGSAQKVPSIDSSCSVNGLGQVTCTFRNLGGSSGETCVYVTLNNSPAGIRTDYENKIQGGPICSGVVQPRDVRQTVQAVAFVTQRGVSYKPSDFCYDYPRKWTDVCSMTTERAR